MESKPWYQSKTIWAGVIGLVVVVYNYLVSNFGVHLPEIPEVVYAILAAFGIKGRVDAKSVIQ